jgi:hypothetical protein
MKIRVNRVNLKRALDVDKMMFSSIMDHMLHASRHAQSLYAIAKEHMGVMSAVMQPGAPVCGKPGKNAEETRLAVVH